MLRSEYILFSNGSRDGAEVAREIADLAVVGSNPTHG